MTALFLAYALPGAVLGAAAAVLAALRPVLKRRYSARWRESLWITLAVLLCLPLGLLAASPLGHGIFPVQTTVPGAESDAPNAALAADAARPDAKFAPKLPSKATASPVFDARTLARREILPAVWLGGAGVSLLLSAGRYALWRRRVRRWERPEEDPAVLALCRQTAGRLGLRRPPRVYRCAVCDGPMLCGIRRPTLLLPEQPLDPADLKLIFLHELLHIRRADLAKKRILLLVAALHWGNTAVYWLAACGRRDIEMACDESMLTAAPGAREPYSRALLTAAQSACRQRLAWGTGFSSEKKEMKERMEQMYTHSAKKRGRGLLGALLGAAVCLALLAGCAAGPRASSKADVDRLHTIFESVSADSSSSSSDQPASLGESASSPDGAPAAVSADSVFSAGPSDIPRTLLCPVPEGTVNRAFVSLETHNGTDFSAPAGTSILAAADGVVTEASCHSVGYGNYIILQHEGYSTLYAHCSKLAVSAGDEVTAGQVIAYVGSTGNSTGCHCHFEVRTGDGLQVDPQEYLTAEPAPAEPAP